MDGLANPILGTNFFSMEESLEEGAIHELMDATSDTGPIQCSDHDELERAYSFFYGDSPLSSACSTPTATQDFTLDLAAANAALAKPCGKRQRTPTPEQCEPTKRAKKAKGSSKKRRDKKKSKELRRLRRQKDRLEDLESTRMPDDAAAAKHLHRAEAEPTVFDSNDIPSTSAGYIALPDKRGRVFTLAELKEKGFTVVPWDGRAARPVTDSDGRVIAVLASQPVDPTWQSVHQDAFRLLYDSAPRCTFTKKSTTHRRGNFPALNFGISFGGGQMRPGNLYHTPKRAGILQDLTTSACFKRIAGFASSTFRTWMPNLHCYYESSFELLLAHDKNLARNFNNSIWAAVAYNFGPQTICAKHRDFANLPFGICAITALGDYDPTLGGHIVLWDLNLVIEFPPGSTVLIPSAAVAHSNTPVAPHEQRASFSQYSAGGLFRWVDHGHQTDAKFMKTLSETAKAELLEGNAARRKLGLSLFPTLASLRKKYA